MAFFLRNPGYTWVRVLVTRRRYEEIVAICGPDVQPEGVEMITTAPLMHASIKIPEARFDEVLRIDTIVRSDITLYLYEPFTPPDEVVVGEVQPISLMQNGESFFFYGTLAVFNQLQAWQRACEASD